MGALTFPVVLTRQRILVPLLLVALVEALACSNHSEKAELPASTAEPVPPVRIVHPAREATQGDLRLSATVRSTSEVTLSAKTTAQITRLRVELGDRVKKGQLLVRLDSSMAAIALQNAQAAERLASASMTNAKAELQRANALRSSGALPEATLDKSQMAFDIAAAQLDQAKAAVANAKKQIADSSITAPFAGVVSARFKNEGDTVAANPPTAILSLVDPEHLQLRLAVPEALLPLIQEDSELSATGSPSGCVFKVKVATVAASVDAQTRTVEVLADIMPPIDPLIRPGTLAVVDLSSMPENRGLFVPADVVFTENGQSYVLALVDTRTEKKPVATRPSRPGTLLVTQGLSTADALIRDPSLVKPGATVRTLVE